MIYRVVAWGHQDLVKRRDALAKASTTTPGKIQKKVRLSGPGEETSSEAKDDELNTPKRSLFQDWV